MTLVTDALIALAVLSAACWQALRLFLLHRTTIYRVRSEAARQQLVRSVIYDVTPAKHRALCDICTSDPETHE